MQERDAEISAIRRVLADGGAGLLIEGPPGIGKTRLLAAARELAGGHGVLSARGSELERDFPFAVVRQLLEPAAHEGVFAGAAALARPVLEGVGGEQDAGSALHGLYWLVANLAAERPLLVLVDDIHWADLASLRWLAYLAQRLDGLAVSLIAAARPAEAGEGQPVLDNLAHNPSIEVLEPRGLSVDAVARAIADTLGPPDDAFTAACARVTGGNPFLLGELLRELATVAPTAANAGLVERQTSRTVSRSALARLRRLPPAATALARAVVILGDGAEPALAAALAELEPDEASRAADALEDAAIVTSRDDAAPAGAAAASAGGPEQRGGRRLSFVHPLVRESVYAELSAGDRARGHARAAQLLTAAGADAERVAIHRHEGDPAGDPEAVRVLREAAASARRRGATEVALSHLRRALLEPPAPEDERAVKRELGAVELQSAQYDAAAEHLAAAADDPAVAAELGAALQLAGRPVEAVAALSAAIDALSDEQRELGLLLQATRAAASQGNREAAALAREAGFRFGAEVDDPRTPGERLFVSGLAYREAMTGDAARARELGQRTLGLLDDPGPGSPAVYSAPLALLFSGALVEATQGFTRVIDWAREHGSFLSFVQGSHLRAGAWWRRGNLAEAEADAENAAAHPSFMIRPAALALVEIRLVQDDVEGAERLWHDLGLEQDPMSGRASVGTRQVRARVRAATGRHEEALAELLASRELEAAWGIRTPAHSTWRSDAVRLLTTLDRVDEALALAEEDVARARRFGDPRPLGMALRAAGLAAAKGGRAAPVGGEAARGAAALLAESVAVLRPSPARLELALSLLELGAAVRRGGKRADAREPLREAVAVAAECGATAVAARAHDELVAAGARPRRDPIESRSRLTASESRVARMAGDGMTNREIAQALFLTEKTIEVHLTSTYRKLDISSRSQLPRALGESLGGAPEVG
ncbi:helix-turn-helix transcriptional regulator [Solirubrobacter soli]|uniref:helix-turn-helix transcriptional regulator n=1 Tax=Solirubrobacter soli TaxID=363832 RepID=UPI0003FAAB12|nr:LuxR family transcriptional regulator [Solirubrobacter soli]